VSDDGANLLVGRGARRHRAARDAATNRLKHALVGGARRPQPRQIWTVEPFAVRAVASGAAFTVERGAGTCALSAEIERAGAANEDDGGRREETGSDGHSGRSILP